jgi:hypothetical protein
MQLMNVKHKIDLDRIDEAMLQSYRSLRTWIGVLAIAFPPLLILVGLFWRIDVQPTLSNYYFAPDPATVDQTPVRLWFCGILFVVGFFLARYPGFTKHEKWWLNAAGGFALGVAIFPMAFNGRDQWGFVLAWLHLPSQLSLHGICAVVAFLCIAVAIFWYSDATLSELETSDPPAYRRYRWAYRGIAAFMVLSIGITVGLKYLFDSWGITSFWAPYTILLAETFGIWAFAAYWFVKNSEMKKVGTALEARRAPLSHRSPPATLANKL